MEYEIRGAILEDVPVIAALVDAYARRGELLPRPPEEIAASLEDWVVAVDGEGVRACGSLVSYSPSLSEVRSLAVAEGAKGLGMGTAMTEALIHEARSRGVRTLFALTRAVPFFERVGFSRSGEERFPEKVRRDCRLCPIQDRCDEQAVVMQLDGLSNVGQNETK